MKCHCCGADITAPQFHEGKAYGWSCINRVAPGKRRRKLACVQADRVEITPEYRKAWLFGVMVAQRLRIAAYPPDHPANAAAWLISENGIVQLEVMGERGPVPAWKSIQPQMYK